MPRDPEHDPDPARSHVQTNRLIHEKSPYLLSHARNPVDWYPWGDEAFSRAARENKPVFLSIGYSTCHWCHVMAHESFEDPDIAAILNREFVSIKVDREERPDIDSVYMAVCQQMTGQGGWPLSFIMTPDKKPLFAGTYFPKIASGGYPGFGDIISRVADLWHTRRDELVRQADLFSGTIGQPVTSAADPDREFIDQGFSLLSRQFDQKHGGFGHAPKFPAPHIIMFLIRYWYLTGSARALDMAVRTLDAIRLGGIHDHIGGGIHRYATDSAWQVPHFEKMLYDQALIALACTEAFLATGNERFRIFAEDCIGYVIRDLGTPEGVFCSAQDADSAFGEGAYYTWTPEEFRGALDPNDTETAAKIFSFVPLPAGPDSLSSAQEITRPQRYVLSVRQSGTPGAQRDNAGHKGEEFQSPETMIKKLSLARSLRSPPARDDKILTDTNALFCTALARAGRAFNNPEYIGIAENAIAFILKNMRDKTNHLFHRYRDGETGIPGFADDYANLASALIELYESTFESRYLETACECADILIRDFADATNGGFFTSSHSAEPLLFRKKEWYDGAAPSANAMAYRVLVQVYRLTGNTMYLNSAKSCARFVTGAAAQAPAAAAAFLAELVTSPESGVTQDLVIAGDPMQPESRAFLAEVTSGYYPGLLVRFREDYDHDPYTGSMQEVPPGQSGNAPDGKTRAYLCSGRLCHPPVTDPVALRRLLVEKIPVSKLTADRDDKRSQ